MSSETANRLKSLIQQIRGYEQNISSVLDIAKKHLVTLPIALQNLSKIEKLAFYMIRIESLKKEIGQILLSTDLSTDKLQIIQKILLQDTISTDNQEIQESVRTDVSNMINEIFDKMLSKIMDEVKESEINLDANSHQINSVLDEHKNKMLNDILTQFTQTYENYKKFKQDIVDVLKNTTIDNNEKVNNIMNYVI